MSNILIKNTYEELEIFEKSLSFELTDPYYYIKKEAISKETCPLQFCLKKSRIKLSR